ncbi:MAG: glycosyltransferase family 39 protein [Candidatus Shapirobacteria bacterium]
MKKNKIILLCIFTFALFLRLYGLNWDQGNHLHPDERYLTMVASDIKLPKSISQYFDTSSSPLNPGNYENYKFFVYGTFPLFVTKIFAVIFNLDDYENIVLVGRILSAFFDSGIIIILYKISKRYLASIVYATTVLPIQLSHFFTVDTFLSFFILLTFYFLTKKRFLYSGIAFGLALACKISALYFLPVVFIFFIINRRFLSAFYFLLFAAIFFRIFQPYAFTGIFSLNPIFVNSLKQLQVITVPSVYFPPSVQWMSKIKLLFPLQNIVIFGLGIPLSIAILFIKKLKPNIINILSLVWIVLLFVYQGTQPVFTMRYFLPIYPFIVLIISQIIPSKYFKYVLIPHLIYCIMFLTVYSIPHTRVQASNWINQNIPIDSVLTTESWDDSIPLNNISYKIVTLEITGPDTSQKWDKVKNDLNSIDYLILSSNRSWASAANVPHLLPDTSNFYNKLFSQKPLIEINSYPGIRLPIKNCYYFGPTNMPNDKSWFAVNKKCNYPGIYFRDDLAEEAFSVYDHPKVLIFKNNISN